MKSNEIACPHCSTPNAFNRENCRACGQWLGAPNVNASRTQEQLSALEKRYRFGLTANSSKQLLEFENVVSTEGAAIKNVDLNMLKNWVMGPHPCYPYQVAVKMKIIEPKGPENDKTRATVDAAVFGSNGYNINFAALAVDEIGLVSYGGFSIKLSNLRVEKMASLLEENSYDFVDKNELKVRKPEIPFGFISDWQNKHKLAVAKLYEGISDVTLNEEFARILLYSDRDKRKDSFIEIHIWGELTTDAIETVRQVGPITTSTKIKRIKEQEVVLKKVQGELGEKWRQ